MFRFERAVRFSEVDMARVVFFPNFAAYCHEALEALFAALPGGYAALVREADVGIPTVHFEVDFKAPLAYGDTAWIDVVVERLGRSSVGLRYTFRRAGQEPICAIARHTIVTASMSEFTTVPVPAHLRALLDQHRD
ncbi:MAG: thioesterase family protein [Vicinamibacterales bacterium]